MASRPDTSPGFIIPSGDSFPTAIAPQNAEVGINSSSGTNTMSGIPMPGSSVEPAPASSTLASSQGTTITEGTSGRLQAGAILGLVLAILTVIGLILFLVRWYFVRQRVSKVTPARTRASHIVISDPTNFQHVSSGDRNANLWNLNDKNSPNNVNVGATEVERRNPNRQPSRHLQTELSKDEGVWATSESPYGRNNPKYTVNFGNLESGLGDHVQTMQGRQPAPRYSS